MRSRRLSLCAGLCVVMAAATAWAAASGPVATPPVASTSLAAPAGIDWSAFLARHDLVWKKTPTTWEAGALLGNGLLGAMVHAADPAEKDGNAIVFELGRTDVVDHRPDEPPMRGRPRLPIGKLRLETVGAISGWDARLSLWDAELTATVTTSRGAIKLRAFVHATLPVLLVEIEPLGGEAAAQFAFRPDRAFNERLIIRKEEIKPGDINPAPFVAERGPLRVSIQARTAGGEYAVAWREKSLGRVRVLALSIADSFPGAGARDDAANAVAAALREGAASLRRSHRGFWHGYYPASFLSLPDTRLESFYWIQMYKLAAATRADRPAIDCLGPWFKLTPWPGYWWNLNLQLTYWPVYDANRLTLGESLLGLIDRNLTNLRNNVPAKFRADSLAVGRLSGPDAISAVEEVIAVRPGGPHELSNLIWIMHNVYLHWRHNMDPQLLRERLFPTLKAAVSYVIHNLEVGADRKLHTPEMISPEYKETARDTNYDLALLRWGCQTLLDLSARLGNADPQAPLWRDTLARLADFPVGPTGYLIGRDKPLAMSHRHFSHLLMVYPLRLVSGEKPADRALIERSLAHWIGFEGALQGYSFVGASAISAQLGKGDDAVGFLDQLISRFVKPNTMYLEAGPVIETPLAGAQAVHELLLQSWGDTVRVFPALPAAWKDVVFRDLLAEGAFVVSAARRAGRTTVVRVESKAGEATVLQLAPDAGQTAARGDFDVVPASLAAKVQAIGPGRWRLQLGRGESVELRARGSDAAARALEPVPADPARTNHFGLR